MKAAIITIGDELLIGQVVDTNSTFISQKLEKNGCHVIEKLTISDNKNQILSSLSKYQNNVDLVIITGGLGPTKDDITKQTLCEYFNDKLESNEEVLAHITKLILDLYQRPLSQINKEQAWLPSKSTILFNEAGTAPGMLLKKEQTTFISLPGVPFEMKDIMVKKVIPYVLDNFSLKTIVHKTLVTFGIGESSLAEKIEDWENSLAMDCISLAYLPKLGMVRLRLSAEGDDKQKIEKQIDTKISELKQLIPQHIVSENDEEELIHLVVNSLKKNKKTIAIAESFTGGLLTHEFTKNIGASTYFKGSTITYSTETKVDVLHISEQQINQEGVVSENVAISMAKNIKKIYKSDYAISTTGNAGPTATKGKESVGTIYIGIATPTDVFAKKYELGQPRTKVVNLGIQKALQLFYKTIL